MDTLLKTQEELKKGSLKINSMLQDMEDKQVSPAASTVSGVVQFFLSHSMLCPHCTYSVYMYACAHA